MGFVLNPLSGTLELSGASSANFATPVPNEASLPVGSVDGALVIVQSTDHVYVYSVALSKWIDTGLTSFAFGSTPNANGYSIILDSSGTVVRNELVLQPADATHPGSVSTGTQSFGGNKTFGGTLDVTGVLHPNGGIDLAAPGTLNIGAANATTINIGQTGGTVNIAGTTLYENVTHLQVADKLMTVNKGGAALSGGATGLQIEENAIITGYAETSADRNSWTLKAPNTAGIATITPGAAGITLAGSITGGTTSGTNTGDITLTAVGAVPNANGASLTGQALTLQPGNATNPGVITSTDWNTFNNKEPAITAGTTSQYWRGDKSFQPLNTAAIGISTSIGSPDITNLQDQFNHDSSAGVTDGAVITDNGNGTVNLTSCTAYLRSQVNITSITRVATTATVTTTANHGFHNGDLIHIRGAVQTAYNGYFTITVTGLNTFTYTVQNSPATPATGTLVAVGTDAQLNLVVVPAITNLALTDHANNYIYADWNNGTPTFAVTTDNSTNTLAGLARVITYIVAREGTTLWIVDKRQQNVDAINKSYSREIETEPYSPVVGGTILTASGTRNIALSSGAFWSGSNRITCQSFDTSLTDTFTTVYTTNSGTTWTYTAGQTQISNTQYNNTATGLASITVGNYGVFWVYVMNNSPSTLMVLYGQGDYNKSQAFGAQEPSLKPTILSATGVATLVGRIIVQQGATSFTNVTSTFIEEFPNLQPTLDSLADVTVPAPNLNDILSWNGSTWVNTTASSVSAGAGVNFYDATPQIIGTTTNNTNPLSTFSRTPVTTAEQTVATSLATNTVLAQAWISSSALNRTLIDGGAWNFTQYAGVNSIAGGRVTTVTRNMYQVTPSSAGGFTVTTTGAGATRTATTTGSAFVAGDANATITVGGYLQTPQGLYKITAFTSATVVTIATPTTYVNETAVTYNKWFNLFGVTSGAITSISPTYSSNVFSSTQPSFTIATTDLLGSILFGTSNNTTTLTTVYNGTAHNTFTNTPLAVLHNDLSGLQGGSSNQYYHLTNANYTDVVNATNLNTASTIVKRDVSGNFSAGTITANITGNVSGTAANVTGIVAIANGGTNSSTALTNNKVMVSTTGSIVESAVTTTTLGFLDATSSIQTQLNGKAALVTGDIEQTSFTAADNQVAAANVTGFAFANASVRAFEAIVSVTRGTTYAFYRLEGIQRAADWVMSQSFTGDTTGLTFSITTAGQLQYTSSSTGSTATVKFRAKVLSV